jgi:sugar O-acyltransferase (sialic acid O-acetyltransferase NeuD family)
VNDESVIVLGAGGHGKSVISVLRASGYVVTGVFDDDVAKQEKDCLGIPVSGLDSHRLAFPDMTGVIAVGKNEMRQALAARFHHIEWLTLIYPGAYVNPTARIGAGTVVFPHAVIGAEAVVGAHAVVSANCTVGHEARLGDFVQLAPGVQVGGEAHLGTGVMMGIGSAIVPGAAIGEWTVVGAGAAVVGDLPAQCTAFGVPARAIEKGAIGEDAPISETSAPDGPASD